MSTTFKLIGVADDRGVRNIGGRAGSAKGPEAFKSVFYSMRGIDHIENCLPEMEIIQQVGDIKESHQSVLQNLSALYKKDVQPIFIGGGHDYAYPFVAAFQEHFKDVVCINIDAHFDLRDYSKGINSGVAFRMLIEEGKLSPENLVEFGIQRHSNSKELFKYAKEKNVKTILFEEVRLGFAIPKFIEIINSYSDKNILISFDLDALSAVYCPGVSAPQVEGLSASEALEMMKICALHPSVKSIGMFELNPEFDVDNRTSRICAQMVFNYIFHHENRT